MFLNFRRWWAWLTESRSRCQVSRLSPISLPWPRSTRYNTNCNSIRCPLSSNINNRHSPINNSSNSCSPFSGSFRFRQKDLFLRQPSDAASSPWPPHTEVDGRVAKPQVTIYFILIILLPLFTSRNMLFSSNCRRYLTACLGILKQYLYIILIF